MSFFPRRLGRPVPPQMMRGAPSRGPMNAGSNLGGISVSALQQIGRGEALRGGISTLLGLQGHDYYNDIQAEKRQDADRALAYQHELQKLAAAREEREASRRASFQREDARERAAQARTDTREAGANERAAAWRGAAGARATAERDAAAERQRVGIQAHKDADAKKAAERDARVTPSTLERDAQQQDVDVQSMLHGGLKASLPFGLGDVAQQAIDTIDPAGSGYDPVGSKKEMAAQGRLRAAGARATREQDIDATRSAAAQRQKDTQAAIAGRFKERMDRLDAALARKEIDRPRYELEKIKAELYHANDNPFSMEKKTPDQIDAEAADRYARLFPGQPMPAPGGMASAAQPPVGFIGKIAAGAAAQPAAKLPIGGVGGPAGDPAAGAGGGAAPVMAAPQPGANMPAESGFDENPPAPPGAQPAPQVASGAPAEPAVDPITRAARNTAAVDAQTLTGTGQGPGVPINPSASRAKAAGDLIGKATTPAELDGAHDDIVKAVGAGAIDPQHAQQLMQALEAQRQAITGAAERGAGGVAGMPSLPSIPFGGGNGGSGAPSEAPSQAPAQAAPTAPPPAQLPMAPQAATGASVEDTEAAAWQRLQDAHKAAMAAPVGSDEYHQAHAAYTQAHDAWLKAAADKESNQSTWSRIREGAPAFMDHGFGDILEGAGLSPSARSILTGRRVDQRDPAGDVTGRWNGAAASGGGGPGGHGGEFRGGEAEMGAPFATGASASEPFNYDYAGGLMRSARAARTPQEIEAVRSQVGDLLAKGNLGAGPEAAKVASDVWQALEEQGKILGVENDESIPQIDSQAHLRELQARDDAAIPQIDTAPRASLPFAPITHVGQQGGNVPDESAPPPGGYAQPVADGPVARVLRAGRTDGTLGANPHGNFTIDNPTVLDPDQEPGNAEHDFDLDALPDSTRTAYLEYLRRQRLVGQGYRNMGTEGDTTIREPEYGA